MKDQKGFTLLEIVITAAIIALVGALSLVSFVNSRRVRDLIVAGQNALSVLQTARANAGAGQDASQWGVRLEQERIILFRGPTYALATASTSYPLPSTVEVADIALAGGGQDVIFKRISGVADTGSAGTFIVRVRGGVAQTFPITIDPSGAAYQTGNAPVPAGTRIKDLRHRTFTFNWGIDDAADLIFTFSDPVDVRTVVMAPAAPRTSYDSGEVKFVVGGIEQAMRVHALSVGASQTALSIDRDCRKNNRKVTIAIRDGDAAIKDIATYEADCRMVTVGAFGGVMAEP